MLLTVRLLRMYRWQTLLRSDAGLRVRSTPAFLVSPGLNATPCSSRSATTLNFSTSWPNSANRGNPRRAVMARMQVTRLETIEFQLWIPCGDARGGRRVCRNSGSRLSAIEYCNRSSTPPVLQKYSSVLTSTQGGRLEIPATEMRKALLGRPLA